MVLHIEALPAIPCPKRLPDPQRWIDYSPLQRYALLRAYGFSDEKQIITAINPVLPLRDIAYLAWQPGPERAALIDQIVDASHRWHRGRT